MTNSKRTHLSWITAALLACLPAAGWSAGGGGGGGSSNGMQAAEKRDPDYMAGEAAVKRKDWPEVVARMKAAIERDAKNADAWNYLGYAHRHLGDMDSSFKAYDTALQLNPRHRGAHEYVGEAWLKVGRPDKAEEHLKALDKLCFFPCEEYTDLKEKLAGYKRAQAAAAPEAAAPAGEAAPKQ